MRFTFLLPALLALLVCHDGARAQEAVDAGAKPKRDLTQLSLEELMQIKVPSVTGASKFEQKITEAPAAVTVISAEEVNDYGYRTLADVLRSVRGLYVSYDRSYSKLGVRGFDPPGDFNGRFLLLVDGHRVNETVFGSALLGTEAILNVDDIDRLEVIRGPASSLYGDHAFFGVINVVTKSGHDINGVEGSVSYGTFESYQGRFTAGKKFENGLEVFLSGSLYASEGERNLHIPTFDTPETNNGVFKNGDADRNANLLLKVSYSDLTLEAAYSSREKDTPTASYGTVFNDPRAQQRDAQSFVELKYQHRFFDDWDVLGRLSYNEYQYAGIFPYNVVLPDDPSRVVLSKDTALGQWLDGEIQVTRKFFDAHTIIVGMEYRDNLTQKQVNVNVDPHLDILSDRRSSQEYGIYAQGEFTLAKPLLLNAGVRFDESYRYGNTIDPRVGLIYHPYQATTVKALYGQAFRRPTPYETYYTGPPFEVNPDIRSERIRTYEAVFEQQLNTNFRFTADAYYNEISNLISEQLDPKTDLLFFGNSDEVNARGVEFELEGRHQGTGIRGRLSYALQETENTATHSETTNSPRHLGKLNIAVPFLNKRATAGFELQYNSSAKTITGGRAGAFWLSNFTLATYKIAPGLELSASVYNLFDQHYGYPGGPEHTQEIIGQDGRTFRVKATYRY